MDDERTGRGAALLDDVPEILCALFGGRVGSKGLLDRIDIVIDGLRKADHDKLVVVLREIGREVGGRRVGIVSADRVKHVNTILDELIRSDLERILALLDKTALDAILHVRELHAAVADRAAAMLRELESVLADLGGDRNGLSLEKPHVTIKVSNQFNVRSLLRIFVDQEAD